MHISPEVQTCEIKLRQVAHTRRMKNAGVLLAKDTNLNLEAVDDTTWTKRTAAAIEGLLFLCQNSEAALTTLTEDYGDIFCPLECTGPKEELRGFLECPFSGQSVYLD